MGIDLNQFLSEMGRWVATSGLRIFAVLVVTLVLLKAARLFLDRAFLRFERARKGKAAVQSETFKPILYNALRGLLVFMALLLVLDSLGFSGTTLLETAAGQWVLTRGLKILVVLTITYLVIRAVSLLLDFGFSRLDKRQDGEMKKRVDTLKTVSRSAATVSLVVIGAIMVLDALEIDVKPILATAGVLGVAVGFGAQQLVRDVINGFFILLDDQIRVGDVVEIAGKGGLVENVNLRMTVLRDLAGNVHYVRNGDITVVTNMTKDWSRYVFEVGVAYRENIDEVVEVLKQIGEELRQDPVLGKDILEPLEILGLDKFADSAVVIKARIKTKPICQWAVGRAFNRRMKMRFDELGIEIPFPHMTLYMGQGKDGGAAPLNVNLPRTPPA
jgi:small conductance mechanosensitive channel